MIAFRTKLRKEPLDIEIGNEKIGKISEFCYLGSKITKGWPL